MNTRFTKELDNLNDDAYDIIYAYDKSDNLPNFIEEHKELNISPYKIRRLFKRCEYIRNKYSDLFLKFNNNISKKELYTTILENMLVILNNIYDLYFVSDINNVEIEYVNQDRKQAQRRIIRLIKKNIFNF
jgi:hypothetical protein